MSTLSKCPFCGSEDVKIFEKTHSGHGDSTCEVAVKCMDCGAQGPSFGGWGNPESQHREKAIIFWNKRKTLIE